MNSNIRDPFGSMQGMIGKCRQFMQNPMGFMSQSGLNIPQNLQNAKPTDIMQHLLNSGKLNQQQLNFANSMARQIQENPQFQQFLNSMMRR